MYCIHFFDLQSMFSSCMPPRATKEQIPIEEMDEEEISESRIVVEIPPGTMKLSLTW